MMKPEAVPAYIATTLRAFLDKPPQKIIDNLQDFSNDHISFACEDCAKDAFEVALEELIAHLERGG